MPPVHDAGVFVFRAGAVICLAGMALEAIEGAWIGAIVFFSLGVALAVLAALASAEGEGP